MDTWITRDARDQLTPEAQAVEKTLWILPKLGPKVRMILNDAQREYDKIRSNRDIITKCRQKGFSTFRIAIQTIKCLGVEGTRAVLISHEAKSTERLLDRARFFLQHMSVDYEMRDVESGEVIGTQDIPLSVNLGRHSRREFYFPQTESTFYIGTAGARAFGRGDTITDLHISEYAWWESDALKSVAGLFQAVPMGGTICIESTGNGRQNDFYYMCGHADELGYQLFFYPWWKDPEYQMDPKPGWEPVGFEHYFVDMQHKYNLSERQLYFYWIKLLEFRLNLPIMQQEYPSSVDECFQASGGRVFKDIQVCENENWKWTNKNQYRIDYDPTHPRENFTYVLGADASGGTGNDEAAVQILTLETFEQVFEFGSSFCDPVEFGHLLCEWGQVYNMAYLIPEGNNHGIATCAILDREYPIRSRIYKRRLPTKGGKVELGFYTGETTKKELVGYILRAIEDGIFIYGEDTIKEMGEFEEDANGRMGAPQDGKVVALGLACVGFYKWRHLANDLRVKPKVSATDYSNCSFRFDAYEWMQEAAKGQKQGLNFFPKQV